MSTLNARIKPKKSSTAGETPVAADLEVAEIAVNTADGKLFVKHTDNSIKEISGGSSGGAVNSVNGQTGTVVLELTDLDDVTVSSATDGDALVWDSAAQVWGAAAVSSGGIVQDTARTNPLSVTTSSLADNAHQFKTLANTARSGQFIKIETSHAARVIYYSTTAARTADVARAQGTSPATSSGVLLEVITTGAETIEVTPAILYQNSEPGGQGELYMSITNISGGAAAIEVKTTVVPIEGRGIYQSELDNLLDVNAGSVSHGQALYYDSTSGDWEPFDVISVSSLKTLVATSTDFADFKTKVAAL